LGDIHFMSGKLPEAEKFYLEAFQKDPNFLNQGDLLKAAITRLFAGDRAAADQAANRYFEARAESKDPILEYRRAQWLWLTGRRKEAARQMEGKNLAEMRETIQTLQAKLEGIPIVVNQKFDELRICLRVA